jgi:regulator of sigma E protease
MQTLILTILVLGLLVFIHELGHFLTAKWAGIAVPRFSIGLGPRVAGIRYGETDYCLSAVPFGGYVKMAGMEGEEAFEQLEGGPVEEMIDEEVNVPPEQRFDNKSIPVRLLVVSAGVLMNFALGWVIFVTLAFSEGRPTVLGTTVEEVDSLTARRFTPLNALSRGATIVQVEGQAVTNWYEIDAAIDGGRDGVVDLALESGKTVSVPVRDDDDRRALSNGLIARVEPLVAELQADGPAARSGIQVSDRIVSIDGIRTDAFVDVTRLVRERPDQDVSVVVERPVGSGNLVTLDVRTGSEKNPRPTDGKFVDMGWLGVTAAVGNIDLGFGEAIVAGTQSTWRAGSLITNGLYQLVSGGVSLRALGGPVAIGQMTGHFARRGLSSLLGWIALFSINLAILNLLPIPVLDGGHVLFLGIEGMRGRPLSSSQKLRLSQLGLVFLLVLMAWAFTADILRLVGL